MTVTRVGSFAAVLFLSAALMGQQPPAQAKPPAAQPANPPAATAPAPSKPAAQPATGSQPQQANPPAAQPAAGAQAAPATPPVAQPAPAPVATQPVAQPATGPRFQLNVTNMPLADLIDHLARRLKMNYILDPRVKPGTVTVNTYGEIKDIDARALLETVLRINGDAMVQVGDIWRIVPASDIARLPVSPQMEIKNFPDDERIMLNLVFLKYALVSEMGKLLQPFMGEGAQVVSYEPANLLLILDNSRNMKRTMELIAMFDSDTLAAKRVRLFETKNNRPSDLARDLDTIMRSVSLSGDKAGAVRFVPVDRINTIIAVAPNPGVFDQVETWLKKLDIPVKVTAGAIDNYVYRVKYGRAEMLAMAIMQLYMGSYGFGYGGMYGGMYGGYGGMGGMGGMYGGMGGMYGGMNNGMYGGGMYGGGMSGGGYPGGYGGMSPYGGAYPGGGYGMGYPGMGYGGGYPQAAPVAPVTPAGGAGATAGSTTPSGAQNQTGTYLGQGAGGYGYGYFPNMPHVTPNPMDNSLLIQGTPQDYAQIEKLLTQLDVPPRQVLIEAKIYEVSLTGAFSSGVQAYLQRQAAQADNAISAHGGKYTIAPGSIQNDTFAGLQLSASMLVGQSRQLLAVLSAQEDNRRSRIISAPSLIATDSVQASINVGTEVPTLSAQAVSPVQSVGSSLFTQAIQNRSSGVTLSFLARVNPSGIVTLQIQQQVSSPVAPSPNSAIQSPSFTNRTVQTQVTVQDGDTIAIGGIIQETDTKSSAGIPGLHRIPILGGAFGAKSLTKERTELVVFITPRVIYDTNQISDATDELKSKFKKLRIEE